VGDRVEVTRQVSVDDLGVPRVDQPVDLPDSVQGAAVGPVGVLLRLQVGLEDRFQDQHRRHLRHAVPDRRDPQRPLLAITFRDEHAPDRLWSVRLRFQGSSVFTERCIKN
jgi:hypothetical protein